MADLTNTKPGNTYKQLLQIGSGNIGLTGSLQSVQDGSGTSSVLQLSTSAINISAASISVNGNALTVSGTATISGTNTGNQTVSGTANEISVANGSTNPVVSLPAAMTFTGKTITGGTFASPTFTTPVLGTPSSGTLTNCSGLPISTGVAGLGTGVATFLSTPSSTNLRTAVTDETGSGSLVFATSPTLVSPILGTPASGTLTNCSGLPIASGISGLASGIATFLATPSSANLRTAMTDESGSGALLFASGAIGTPSSGTLTNCTGLPLSTGITGTLPIANGGTGITSSKPIVQQVYTLVGSVGSSTSLIPADDTIPQITEGSEYMTLSITPTNASNLLVIRVSTVLACSVSQYITTALFQDATASALSAKVNFTTGANSPICTELLYIMVAGTTSATTFRVRAGANAASTVTFNGWSAGTRQMGGVMNSYIHIQEIVV